MPILIDIFVYLQAHSKDYPFIDGKAFHEKFTKQIVGEDMPVD